MRRSGTIRTWKDDEGFGFIRPEGGGDDAFVHITGFAGRGKGRRPIEGEVVTFEQTTDSKGRLRAENVAFAGENVLTRALSRPGAGPIGAGLVYLGVLAIAAGLGRLPWAVPILAVGMCLVAFLAYSIDKSAARAGKRRIPEATLHSFSLLGGWPGAIVAQRWLHHKSSKTSFQIIFWATVALNVVGVAALASPSGRRVVLALLHVLES